MPHVMPFAGMYGHNTTDNFNYCMKNIFTGFGGEFAAPFYNVMGFFTKTLMGLLNSINSMRVMLGTLVGGITTVFSEFNERLRMFFLHIKMTAMRMRQLMNRVMGTMFSIMYMGMSGITSATNFGDTVLFGFLDTFCFDPDTLVRTRTGERPISTISIGDVLIDMSDNPHKVSGVFRFLANGQPMRDIDSIIVSTNHYIYHEDRLIEVKDHPDARVLPAWSGGIARPLICLNTVTHKIPIGAHLFADYDETEEGDVAAMYTSESTLNPGRWPMKHGDLDYSPCFASTTKIKMGTGNYINMNSVKLGDKLANGGEVIGTVRKIVTSSVYIDTDQVTPSTLVWSPKDAAWIRAGDIIGTNIIRHQPRVYYNLFVSPHSSIETGSGNMYRDYIELLDPSMRESYSAAMEVKKAS